MFRPARTRLRPAIELAGGNLNDTEHALDFTFSSNTTQWNGLA